VLKFGSTMKKTPKTILIAGSRTEIVYIIVTPWNPVAIKKDAPYTASEMVKGDSIYS
jgi:hypothetical protein